MKFNIGEKNILLKKMWNVEWNHNSVEHTDVKNEKISSETIIAELEKIAPNPEEVEAMKKEFEELDADKQREISNFLKKELYPLLSGLSTDIDKYLSIRESELTNGIDMNLYKNEIKINEDIDNKLKKIHEKVKQLEKELRQLSKEWKNNYKNPKTIQKTAQKELLKIWTPPKPSKLSPSEFKKKYGVELPPSVPSLWK